MASYCPSITEEQAALIRYHFAKFTKKLRWILEAWRETPKPKTEVPNFGTESTPPLVDRQ